MKKGFYFRLAGSGIIKNKKFYYPYIITCICMIMTFYIICYLRVSADLSNVRGGDMTQSILGVGVYVIALFALIFLYYTNSFLIRRRKREFGLYNILGMGKGNLLKILVWENIINAVISLTAGLGFGILFSKLAELAAIKLLGGTSGVSVQIAAEPLILTAVLFLIIFALIMFRMIISIFRLRPAELLKSESVGEKPPKANRFVALLGAGLLGGAYYLAVAVMDPMSALLLFFLAVVMVIIATYFLFISGSVVMCRLLQKNKKYYYKTNHFISVSSMAYRMKRNGAGLASICILSTMMLVSVSSTICLYGQIEDYLDKRYPSDITIELSDGPETEVYREAVQTVIDESGADVENMKDVHLCSLYALQNKDIFRLDINDTEEQGNADYSGIRRLYVMSADEYNAVSGESRKLGEDEMLLYALRMDYPYDTLTIEENRTWNVTLLREPPFQFGKAQANAEGSLFLVTDSTDLMRELSGEQNRLAGEDGQSLSRIREYFSFDLDCGDEQQKIIYDDILTALNQVYGRLSEQGSGGTEFYAESRAYGRQEAAALYGGLLFLGLLLGAVFLFGTVLIMYYKQISEGYEDQDRFAILKKVGMTEKEVKKSINSQVLIVFFLPMATAGIHLAFAFPLISKILSLMSTATEGMFAVITACCYLIFAVFYVVVYKITSGSYYTIVMKK